METADPETLAPGAAIPGARHPESGGASVPSAPPAPPVPPTSAARPTQPPTPEIKRLTSHARRESVYAVVGSGLAAVSLTALLTRWFAPFSGKVGFTLIAFALFILVYGLVVSFDEDARTVRDRIAALVAHSVAVFVFGLLVLVVLFPLIGGFKSLIHLNFYTQDLRAAGPLAPVTISGVQQALVGTLEQITITMAVTVPLGIACALFLNEVPGRLANLVRTVAAAATALPSIVAGLFVFALVILEFGLPKSGLAASVALSVMTLPIIIRASDVVLRLVPGGLKEASYALGAGRWRTALMVTLPTARSGLATAVILGAARGIGETSPVLLTAGYSQYTNTDPLKNPQTSLPLATFKLVTSGQPGYISRGYGAAALLMLLVLILFALARSVGGRGPGQLTARQRRRRDAASVRLAARFGVGAGPDSDSAAESESEYEPETEYEPESEYESGFEYEAGPDGPDEPDEPDVEEAEWFESAGDGADPDSAAARGEDQGEELS